MAYAIPGERFICISGNDVHVCVKNLLASNPANVPPDIITIRSIPLIQIRFGLIRKQFCCCPLLRIQIKHCRYMPFWNYNARADQNIIIQLDANAMLILE